MYALSWNGHASYIVMHYDISLPFMLYIKLEFELMKLKALSCATALYILRIACKWVDF